MSVFGKSMKDKRRGKFSSNFFSLQLQLKTLLEEVGGREAEYLLDLLADFSHAEKEIILRIFRNLAQRVASQDIRVENKTDKELKEIEDNLYSEIIANLGSLQRECIPLSPTKNNKLKLAKSKVREKKEENKIISLQNYRR